MMYYCKNIILRQMNMLCYYEYASGWYNLETMNAEYFRAINFQDDYFLRSFPP